MKSTPCRPQSEFATASSTFSMGAFMPAMSAESAAFTAPGSVVGRRRVRAIASRVSPAEPFHVIARAKPTLAGEMKTFFPASAAAVLR